MAIGTGAAIIIGAAVSTVGSIIASNKSSSAAKSAGEQQAQLEREQAAANERASQIMAAAQMKSAEAQAKAAVEAAKIVAAATNRATDVQWKMYSTTRRDQMPWLKAGQKAVNILQQKMTAGPGEYTESPDYQFLLSQGEEGVNRLAASRGQYFSGGAAKQLARYDKDLASLDYDKFLQRYYASLQPYQSQAGLGQTTATNLGAAGQQTASNVGNLLVRGGEAQAAGRTSSARAIGEGYIGSANALAQGQMAAAQGNYNAGNALINSNLLATRYRMQGIQNAANSIGTMLPYAMNAYNSGGASWRNPDTGATWNY